MVVTKAANSAGSQNNHPFYKNVAFRTKQQAHMNEQQRESLWERVKYDCLCHTATLSPYLEQPEDGRVWTTGRESMLEVAKACSTQERKENKKSHN
uniref:Uncharacterized protein n=1 Tax=Rhipicephalus zambeziensis TaxID=60191 RepID=A0A224YEM5_9ACAR